MANDVNEWDFETYQAWKEALAVYCETSQAEKSLTEGFDLLRKNGHYLEGTRRSVLTIAAGLRDTAHKQEQEAFERHVEAFLNYRNEEKEKCDGVHNPHGA